jgi:hypothetical protein
MVRNEEELSANGLAAAAILAAAIGCFTLGVLALAGDAFPAVAGRLSVWNPTGPLSGVTGLAVLVWIVSWIALERAWRHRTVNASRINLAAAVMLVAAVLLTFPPFMDLLQGK